MGGLPPLRLSSLQSPRENGDPCRDSLTWRIPSWMCIHIPPPSQHSTIESRRIVARRSNLPCSTAPPFRDVGSCVAARCARNYASLSIGFNGFREHETLTDQSSALDPRSMLEDRIFIRRRCFRRNAHSTTRCRASREFESISDDGGGGGDNVLDCSPGFQRIATLRGK